MMGSGTIYRGFHLKVHLFKMGLTVLFAKGSHKKDESAAKILCEHKDIAHFSFHHLDHSFMVPNDYHDAPLSRILHFIQNVGLSKY
jgi:hypothetical protein